MINNELLKLYYIIGSAELWRRTPPGMMMRGHVNTLGIALAWRRASKRTKWLASLLRLEEKFFRDPPPYILSLILTLKELLRRPKVVLIQGTHGPLLLLTVIFRKLLNYTLIVDTHSNMVVPSGLKSYFLTVPFSRFLRLADIVILHDPTVALYTVKMGYAGTGQVLVVRDPPISCGCRELGTGDRHGRLSIVFPSGGLPDEPLEELVNTINRLSNLDVVLIITGPHTPSRSGNVLYTGFLPYREYLETLCKSDLVLAITTRPFTILSAALEAVYCDKPLIASSTLTLRVALRDAAIYMASIDELPQILERLTTDREVLDKLRARAAILKGRMMKEQRSQIKELLVRILEKIGKHA